MAIRTLPLESKPVASSIAGLESPIRPFYGDSHTAELDEVRQQLESRRRLLEVVAKISTLIARSSDLSVALLEGLGMIGEAGQFSRCLLLQRQPTALSEYSGQYEVVAEWCAPGVRSHQAYGTDTIASQDAAEFVEMLRHGETFWCRIDEVNQPLRAIFQRMEIRATGCSPILVDDELWGTLAFDDCVRDNPWDEAHVDALTAVANAISNALQTQHRAEKLAVERAEAAQKRALELAKANEALRLGVERIAGMRETREIIEAFLVEAIRSVSACGGAILLHVPGTASSFRAEAVYEGYFLTTDQIGEHPYLGALAELTARNPMDVFASLLNGEFVMTRTSDFEQGFPEAFRYHSERGDKCIWNAPLRLKDRTFGYMGFALATDDVPSAAALETVRALCHQLVLALELTRLAEESKATALLRERETAAQNRAAELELANQALRRGTAGLGQLDDLSHFLGEMLKAAVSTSGAHAGGVVILDETAQTYRVYPLLRAHGGFEPEGTELTSPHPVSPTVQNLFREINATSTAWLMTETDHRMDPEFVNYHRAEGNLMVAHIPMRVGDRLIGMLGLGFASLDAQFERELPLLRSLADQMSFAVQMVRLSEEAKSAAIAREREKAAREHAAELARANEALRKGVDGLVRLENLDLFLREMLKAAVVTAGAHGGAVSLLDDNGESYRFAALLLRDGSFAPGDSPLLQPIRVTPGLQDYLSAIMVDEDAWSLPPDDALHAPDTRAFHEAEQNRALRHIPMVTNGRLIGLLGLGFPDPNPQFGRSHSLLRVLADQMTMAVEMLRVSEEARSAAIAREREQAAQARLSELERVNHLLLLSAEALAQARTPDEICELFLMQAVEAMQGTAGGLLELVEGTEHSFAALVQNGVIVARESWEQLPLVVQNRKVTKRDEKGLMARLVGGSDVWIPVDEEFAAWAPEAAEYHREHGHAAVVLWPFYFDKVMRGYIGLAFSEEAPLTDSQRETLKALSSQASLALELNALTAKVETAAIAQERERGAQQRAIELIRSNEELALRDRLLTASAQALEDLISAENFASGVADALRQIGEAAQLSRVQVLMETTLPTGERAHELVHEWWSDELDSQNTLGHLSFPNTDFQEVIDLLYQGERWWARTEDWPSGVQPVFRELGIVWTGVVPICVQQEYVGLVAFDQCKAGHDWSDAEIDALTIAAKGIGAALSQQRMAAQLVSEREQAAQDRASELIKANEALRTSVDDLVTQTTTDGILTSLLKQAVDISGASSGAILKRIAGSEFEYVTIYAGGMIRTSDQILAAGTNTEMRLASRIDPTGHFAKLSLGEAQRREVDEERLAKHLPRSTSYHRLAGCKSIYDFPYKVAGHVFGYLGLAFAGEQPPSVTVQETIKALATQVGLALEFRKISEQLERAAVIEERNKFARDLHDTLAQGFAAIIMQLGAVDQVGPPPSALQPYLTRIEDLARSNLAEARRTVSELRTSERVRDPFLLRLSELARQIERVCGSIVQTQVKGNTRNLPPVVEDELFLIAQESLTNAMKHADAVELKVELVFTDSGLRVKVRDNGKGFLVEEQARPEHFGLQTMQERAQRIHAKLTIISEPGFGTEILTIWNDPTLE